MLLKNVGRRLSRMDGDYGIMEIYGDYQEWMETTFIYIKNRILFPGKKM